MRLLSVLALLLALAVPAHAQTQAQPRTQAQPQIPPRTLADVGHSGESRYLVEDDYRVDQQSAFLHFATHYTEAMVIGLGTGGLLMNWWVGGLPATLAGTVAGAVIASWLYLDQAAGVYVIREVH
jgi:hypothetical protein